MIESWNKLITNPATPELNCNITSSGTLCNITSITDFLDAINCIIRTAPPFHGSNLIGVPLAAFMTGFDATLSGQTLFRIPEWNKHFQNILCQYNHFLSSNLSDYVFRRDGSWVKNADRWNVTIWELDSGSNESYPWYYNWNSFFTRHFKNPSKSRPISSPNDVNVIVSSNDGALFRWRKNINRTQGFWFKDMPYSLTDIFKSHESTQQAKLDGLPDRFANGSIFQTFLDPFNYHRWWSPVDGKVVLFDPMKIDEAPMYFSKIVLPDYQGSTTYSLPYLLQTNSRGILVIDTTGYANIGYVCIIPIGMVEVSTIVFTVAINDEVHKGDEIGYFQFGGSSFALIFEDLAKYNKHIEFTNGARRFLPNPPLPQPTPKPNQQEVIVSVGAQIAQIHHYTQN